jgi:hypothetical protein
LQLLARRVDGADEAEEIDLEEDDEAEHEDDARA